MVEVRQPLTVARLKAEAKRHRQQRKQDGDAVSHSAALEHVARTHGFRDWNTARARAAKTAPQLRLGQRVSGRYLGRPFKGELLGLQRLSAGQTRVEIQFDTAVDVVRFASFSSLRKRIRGVVRPNGTSTEKISTGDPQLVIDQMQEKSGGADHGE